MRHATTRDVVLSDGNKARVIGAHRDVEPLHSEGYHPESKISDFYPLFEDLLIMGGSKCVVYGIGSFGAFVVKRNVQKKNKKNPSDEQ